MQASHVAVFHRDDENCYCLLGTKNIFEIFVIKKIIEEEETDFVSFNNTHTLTRTPPTHTGARTHARSHAHTHWLGYLIHILRLTRRYHRLQRLVKVVRLTQSPLLSRTAS